MFGMAELCSSKLGHVFHNNNLFSFQSSAVPGVVAAYLSIKSMPEHFLIDFQAIPSSGNT